jgi:serine/threonine protein phosphatase 1
MERLPHFLEIPEAIILHAFLEPDVPLDQQDPRIICGSLSGEHILRQRYRQPWYEMCDRDKPVIVGHRNYTGTDCPFIYKDKVIGLDTDCVRGKTLTGILLPSFQIFSVRSRGDLWSQVRQQFPHIGRKAPAEPSVSEPSAWSDEDQSVLESLIAALKLECHETWERIQVSAGPAGSVNALKIFSREVGKGLRSHLLHLARLDRLNSETARQAIGSPETMRSLFR